MVVSYLEGRVFQVESVLRKSHAKIKEGNTADREWAGNCDTKARYMR